jgi:hypothetical protein
MPRIQHPVFHLNLILWPSSSPFLLWPSFSPFLGPSFLNSSQGPKVHLQGSIHESEEWGLLEQKDLPVDHDVRGKGLLDRKMARDRNKSFQSRVCSNQRMRRSTSFTCRNMWVHLSIARIVNLKQR